MKDIIYLDGSKQKYKGNLHTHTTRSDGQYSPEEVVRLYRENNYNFICITDHEIYFKSEALNSKDFILLSGYEVACNMENNELGLEFHINGLLDESLESIHTMRHDEKQNRAYCRSLLEMQTMIDEVVKMGNLAVINHPNWSRNRLEDLLALAGNFAIEIYNNHHHIERSEAVGYSVQYWDYLLRNGRKVYGVANDDSHVLEEYFGGWVCVEARVLKQQSIIEALKQGSFYSSNGPKIYDMGVADNVIKVRCSKVKIIKFVVYTHAGVYADLVVNGQPFINSASYNITGEEQYIRIECIDCYDKTAWSNPIFLE